MVTTTTGIAALSATCPLCHTQHDTVPPAFLQTGASWSCTRCGQAWTAIRMETVAAYTRFMAAL